MLNRLGLAEEGQGDTAEQAFHFRGLLQRGGVHAIPPIEKLCIHAFKGRAGDHILGCDGDEVALHVVHLVGIDLEQFAFELRSNECPVFFVFESVGVKKGMPASQHTQTTVQMEGVGPRIIVRFGQLKPPNAPVGVLVGKPIQRSLMNY